MSDGIKRMYEDAEEEAERVAEAKLKAQKPLALLRKLWVIQDALSQLDRDDRLALTKNQRVWLNTAVKTIEEVMS